MIIVFTIIGAFILLRHIKALVRSMSDPARNVGAAASR